MKVGVQMYTLRDACKDLASFSDTLGWIADKGFPVFRYRVPARMRPIGLRSS